MGQITDTCSYVGLYCQVLRSLHNPSKKIQYEPSFLKLCLKKPIINVLPNIKKIQTVYFEFKNKEIHSENRQIGFIAQNIQKYYPELVEKGEDEILSVNYSGMSVVLLRAINEQQEMIGSIIQPADIPGFLMLLVNIICQISPTPQTTS